jgi:hypothetical protein
VGVVHHSSVDVGPLGLDPGMRAKFMSDVHLGSDPGPNPDVRVASNCPPPVPLPLKNPKTDTGEGWGWAGQQSE